MNADQASSAERPAGVNLIMLLLVGSILGTVIGWPLIAAGLLPAPREEFPLSYSWLYGDVIVALPISVIALFGLRSMRLHGLWATLLYCGAVLYSTPVLAASASLRGLSPFSIVELPAYPLSVACLIIPFYLWRIRSEFD